MDSKFGLKIILKKGFKNKNRNWKIKTSEKNKIWKENKK